MALSVVLVWAISVFLWVGDLETAETHIDWFIARAEAHSLRPYLAAGRGYQGQLAIRRGNPAIGVESIRSALAELGAMRYGFLTTTFSISLVEGLSALGRFDEAIDIAETVIKSVDDNGDASYMPELLRHKAIVLRSTGRDDDAERCLVQAFELSRRQSAVAWELRIARDLAVLWSNKRNPKISHDIIGTIRNWSPERMNTAEIKICKKILTEFCLNG